MKYQTDDLRILGIKEVISPSALHAELPITEQAAQTTAEARLAIRQVLRKTDDRLLAVVGPCSIHDPEAAREYAAKLRVVQQRLSADLLLVMRVYFEKPRTTVGWKGLINDPDLDGSFHINQGLRIARRLLLDINKMGLPAGTEYLDLITPQYVTDLVSWGAIGARTTESQVHRELASGLSCPVGFKNGTNGTVKLATDAIGSARQPHNFLSVTKAGHSAIFATRGNEDCHLILRGGREPNYDSESVHKSVASLEAADLPSGLMIDFSHANSLKQYQRQMDVGRDVAGQLAAGERQIVGCMVESNLKAGNQSIVPGKTPVYGQSITDACLGWEDTERLLEELAEAVRARRGSSSKLAS